MAFRPEIYRDPDGGPTKARQTIRSFTGTVKYQISPRHQRLVGTLEVRHDRSTGEEGGFFRGQDNALVPDQSLVLVGLLWSFDG